MRWRTATVFSDNKQCHLISNHPAFRVVQSCLHQII